MFRRSHSSTSRYTGWQADCEDSSVRRWSSVFHSLVGHCFQRLFDPVA